MEIFSRAAKYFDAVAREGSVRAAAKSIRVAASAINRHIIELEREAGVPLFDRSAKGMRLSAAGEILVHRLRLWRADSQRTQEMLSDLRSLRRGHVRLSTVEGPLGFILHDAIETFTERFPKVGFDIEVTSSRKVISNVEEGLSEVGVTFNPPSSRSIREVVSVSCRVGAAMSPTHPLAALSEVRINHLADLPVGIPTESLSLQSVVEVAEERAFVKLWRASKTNSIGSLKALALRPPYVALLSDVDIYAERKAGVLIHRPLAGNLFAKQTFAVIAHRGASPATATAVFLEHLAEKFRTTFLGEQREFAPARRKNSSF